MNNSMNNFIKRVRKILSHSMIDPNDNWLRYAEHLGGLQYSAPVNAPAAVRTTVSVKDFPKVELVESLVARLRPLMMPGDPIHYSKVINRLKQEVSLCSKTGKLSNTPKKIKELNYIQTCFKILDYTTSREVRKNLVSGSNKISEKHQKEIKKYYGNLTSGTEFLSTTITSENGVKFSTLTPDGGYADIVELASSWIYGDSIHSDYRNWEKSSGLKIQDRYSLAYPLVFHIVYVVAQLYKFIINNPQIVSSLAKKSIISRNAFTEPVNSTYPSQYNFFSMEQLDNIFTGC